MGVNSLPKTVTRQRRDCDLNPDPSAPESSTHDYTAANQLAPGVEGGQAGQHVAYGWRMADGWSERQCQCQCGV